MKDRFSSWFWDFVVMKGVFRGFFRRREARMRAMEQKLDESSGIDSLPDFHIPQGAQGISNSRANTVARFRNFEVPPLLQIAPTIAAGKVFGLEYLALTPPDARHDILGRLRSMLPYARIGDEGEIERVVMRPYRNRPARSARFWTVSIVLAPPGYGIGDAQIETHEADFVAAAREMRVLADALVQSIVETYEIDWETLPHLGCFAGAPGGEEHGRGLVGETLDDAWKIDFASGAWNLRHGQSGQEVRVSLFHREVGGLLHPHGFSRFLKTTPQWEFLGALLGDDYFDARRVIERLHERGCWEIIPRNAELRLLGTNGLAAPLPKP